MTRPAPLAASVLVAWVLAMPQAATAADAPDPVTARAVELAPSMATTAQEACDAAARHPTLSAHEVEFAIRDTDRAMDELLKSAADLPAALERMQSLQAKVGDLDRTASLDLQRLQAMLAGIGGDTARQAERRAFNLALLTRIAQSGDGKTPATAFKPCLVGNEYGFARTVLRAADISGQQLISENGRHYDRLTLTREDGSREDVFFDITEAFQSQRKQYERERRAPAARP